MNEPLLVFPDPPVPELAQTLDLAGWQWKAVSDENMARRSEPDAGWAGAIICADRNPEAAFAVRARCARPIVRSNHCCC